LIFLQPSCKKGREKQGGKMANRKSCKKENCNELKGYFNTGIFKIESSKRTCKVKPCK